MVSITSGIVHFYFPLFVHLNSIIYTYQRHQESLSFRPFSAIWVENNGGTEALLAAPSAFSAKLVVFLTTTLIKKERPFSLEIFRHTRHNGYNGHLLIAA